jgi:hypothetical protein
VGDQDSQPSNLVYDGTFVWVTLKGAGQVTRIHAQTGLVMGEPVICQPITVSDKSCEYGGEGFDGIAFDGRYIWIASNNGCVHQLRAKDATLVSDFQAANHDSSKDSETVSRIAFDGTFVWIIINDGKVSSFTRR